MIDLTSDPRAALEIRRFHTWRTIQSQSVGEHSAQIARIMLTVWPRCPRRLLIHAVTHDMGEMCGDVAYPFKKMFPEIADGMAKAEHEVRMRQRDRVGTPPLLPLSAPEKKFFKICEYIEMMEFGFAEYNLGNKYGAIIVARMREELRGLIMEEVQDHPGIPRAIEEYVSRRLAFEELNQ